MRRGSMTATEIKNFFRQIRKEQNEIAHLAMLIQQEETMLLPKAIVYDKDKVQVSPEDKFSDICARISDMQEELGESIVKLKAKQMTAERMIRNLSDPDEREVMRWYYMTLYDNRPLTWQDVAIRMNYYRRHVIRIHGNALAHLVEDGTK
jgi:hypothetical protein